MLSILPSKIFEVPLLWTWMGVYEPEQLLSVIYCTAPRQWSYETGFYDALWDVAAYNLADHY